MYLNPVLHQKISNASTEFDALKVNIIIKNCVTLKIILFFNMAYGP